LGHLVVTVEEGLCRVEQGFNILKKLTVRDFTTKLPPQHLNRMKPGALGGQDEQDQAPNRPAHNRFYLILLMGAGLVQRHEDRARAMRINQSLKPFSHFYATLTLAKQNDDFASMIIHCAQATAFVRLARGRDPDLLAFGSPDGAQRRL
jgi:hypothetical protein